MSSETVSIRPVLGKHTDDQILATLGYKQEFKRAFSPLEVSGLVFSVMGLFSSMASVLVYALPNGGPVAMVWGWAICSTFIVMVGLALAEMGSAAPTAGGLYYWTFLYMSPRWRNLLSWLVGYCNTIGLISGVAAVDWGCAVQLMAAVSIGSGTTFVPTTSQTYGVFAAIIFCHAMVASLATSIVARLQIVYAALNISLGLAIIIALPIATPSEFKNSARYAFGGFDNQSGWPNGFAFILSFLAPLWSIAGFDASLHISEEASNASIAVPWAIVGAISLAGVLGFGINIALAFCMGTDIEAILASPIGQPMAAILFNSFGQRGTLAVWSIVVTVQFMMGTSTLLASSRQTFAFARDGGLPFSRYLYRVNRYTTTPVNCTWFSASIALLLGLLAFAGSEAISAVFSLSVVGSYLAFIIPIVARFTGGKPWVPGPFTLGRLGFPIAMIAVAWMIFSIVILVFPSSPGPSAADMNYTIIVFGGWIGLCLAYYYFPVYGGAHWFRGPIANIVDGDDVNLGEEKGSVVDEKSVD